MAIISFFLQVSVDKESSPPVITLPLSSEQCDAILQSLNISLTSEQTAAIHLDGASQSDSSGAPSNVIKIFNKNKATESSADKSATKCLSEKDSESSTAVLSRVNSTRSNTPSSSNTMDSPLSIPSGYTTPVPNISSDISFMSHKEVHDILKNIENQSNDAALNAKTSPTIQENKEMYSATKIKSADRSNHTSKDESISSISQVNSLISNDSLSTDSINLEVSNILKNKKFGDNDNLLNSKPFLIDEKTLLSPIKVPHAPSQILLPSSLITPPHTVPETIFVFSTPSASFQTAQMKENSNVRIVPRPVQGSFKSNVIFK